MPSLGGLLGNSTLQQLVVWNIASQAIGAAMSPFLNELTATVNAANPAVPLSPADAAEAVIRNAWPEARATAEAARSGFDAERFGVMLKLAGNAPDPTSLATALRRKIITADQYMEGIRQGRLRDEWADVVRQLAVQQPSPEAMLSAYLEGQVDEGTARSEFAKLGGDPSYFDVLYNTQGQAPSPVEALDLANRGVIPWDGSGAGVVSFEQAFLEGPWRNKWAGPFRALGEYLPPPRTVTAMYKEGSITRARAIELLRKQGLAPDLAAAYVSSGAAQKTQPTKDLAQSTATTLYRDRLISRQDAASFLEALHYDAAEADFILQVVDVEVAQKYLSTAVGRVHTLYIGHKMDRNAAGATLAQLKLPASNVSDLLGIWDYERAANVVHLSAAQIASALKAELIDQPTAQAKLVQMGYQPWDAWLYLSISQKTALPDQPAQGALAPAPGP